jgi:hypothetical protein
MSSKFPTRYYSSKQEKHIAKELNGKQVSNSGATRFDKGDVVLSDWLIEAKTCTQERKSFVVKKEWIDKNKEESFAMGKSYSAVAIDFGDGEQHYIISEKLFKLLVNYLKEEEN